VRDSITVTAIVAWVAASCAVIVMVGSLILLWTGAVKLTGVNANQGIKFKFMKTWIVETRNPALGLFVVGIFCLCIAGWCAQSQNVSPMRLTAKLVPHPVDIPIALFENHDLLAQSSIDTNGEILAEILPKIVKIRLRIPTPGYEPGEIIKSLPPEQAKDGVLDFGTFSPGIKKVEKPGINPDQIDPVPAKLAPLQDSNTTFSSGLPLNGNPP